MKLAFCIYQYFPTGGLQQDFLKMVQRCLAHGHHIDIYTTRWQGQRLETVAITFIKTRKFSNHKRMWDFSKQCHQYFKQQTYDLIIGFNKMPGLDVYFAGDDCYQKAMRQRHHPLYTLSSRARHYVKLEKSIFSAKSSCHILYIAPPQLEHYYQCYQTPPARFHLLPPACEVTAFSSTLLSQAQTLRQQQGVKDHERVLLFVASHFHTKGLDRVLRALAKLTDAIAKKTHCWIIGSEKSSKYEKLAKQLAITVPLKFMGIKSQLAPYYQVADILIHPARQEAAGKVLLEAMHYGTAVLTTSLCGYASYIIQAQAGCALTQPFSQSKLNATLAYMLDSKNLQQWQQAAQAYSATQDYNSMHSVAADLLEIIAKKKNIAPTIYSDQLYHTTQTPKALMQWLQELPNLNEIFHIKGEIFRNVPSRRTIKFQQQQQNYFIKLHSGIGWREIFKNLLHLRRPILSARNEWHATQYLNILNIATTPPLCYGQLGSHPAYQCSFLITQAIANLVGLDQILAAWHHHYPSPHVRRSWIQGVAHIIRTMHQAGMNHNDCYLCHFTVSQPVNYYEPLTHATTLYIMDLHRAHIYPCLPIRWRVKDLAALAFSTLNSPLSHRDKLYFIQCYHQQKLSLCLRKHKKLWSWVHYKIKHVSRKTRLL